MQKTYHALITRKTNDGFRSQIEERQIEELPADDVLIRVHYSSVNYKDALSVTGNRGVIRG